MPDDFSELDEQIEQIALAPQAQATDGRSVTERSVDDLLKLRRFKAGLNASDNPGGALRIAKIVPVYDT